LVAKDALNAAATQRVFDPAAIPVPPAFSDKTETSFGSDLGLDLDLDGASTDACAFLDAILSGDLDDEGADSCSPSL
jgi:hypothetical protein